MYVTSEMIEQLHQQYGKPSHASFSFPVDATEYKRIRASQKHGRKHDITMYIFKGDRIIVIAKPFYPPGLYRAPSGGLQPGEPLVDGALREAHEETGCDIAFEHFLLESEVSFVYDEPVEGDMETNGQRSGIIEWTSYIFQARYVSGDFQFTDHREIREVRLAQLDEFRKYSSIMRSSNVGGLHYRAALHETIEPLLIK